MKQTLVDAAPIDGLDPQIGLLLSMLDDGTHEWREELGDVSEEALVWQPFPGGHSIGALMLHIADTEASWIHEVAAGQPRSPEELARLLSAETRQYRIEWPVPPRQPLAWYVAQMDETRARTMALVAALNDPLHVSPKTRSRTGQGDFTLRWILHHVLTHEAYHGGQAVLLSIMHFRH